MDNVITAEMFLKNYWPIFLGFLGAYGFIIILASRVSQLERENKTMKDSQPIQEAKWIAALNTFKDDTKLDIQKLDEKLEKSLEKFSKLSHEENKEIRDGMGKLLEGVNKLSISIAKMEGRLYPNERASE